MAKWRAAAFLIFVAALAFVLLPCRPAPEVRGLTLAVSFAARPLTENLFTDITFRFRTGPSFTPPPGESRVVAEFSTRGRPLSRITIQPAPAAAAWAADKEYVFTRRVYIPAFIDSYSPSFRGSETVSIAAGLVGTGEEGVPERAALFRRRLRVLPAPDTPVIVYASGWYAPESGPGYSLSLESSPSITSTAPVSPPAAVSASTSEAAAGSVSGTETVFPPAVWRWTEREARCIVGNPGRDALLAVVGSVEPDATPGQTISIRLGDELLDEFAPAGRDFARAYTVEKGRFGGRRDLTLTIGAAKTFVPARTIPGSTDTRELGVRVALIYFR